MKRKPRPWTRRELVLLGVRPDAEAAELTGRTFGTVWQKRRALGIAQPLLRFRKWTAREDELVGTAPDAEVAARIDRTESGVRSRRAILERACAKQVSRLPLSNPALCPAVLEALGSRLITVPRDPFSQSSSDGTLPGVPSR